MIIPLNCLCFRETLAPSPGETAKPEPQQRVTPLLLFAIFSIAARFVDHDMPQYSTGKMWDAGCEYVDCAKEIIGIFIFVPQYHPSVRLNNTPSKNISPSAADNCASSAVDRLS